MDPDLCKPPADVPGRRFSFSQLANLIIIALLAGNLYVFGQIAAGIGRIAQHLADGALSPVVLKVPVPGTPAPAPSPEITNAATASGNIVTVEASPRSLPPGPRTVEQVAAYLDVTPDTVRESYIPDWIAAGLMKESDRTLNRWMVPGEFTPYRTK